jgi:hypothetical protein
MWRQPHAHKPQQRARSILAGEDRAVPGGPATPADLRAGGLGANVATGKVMLDTDRCELRSQPHCTLGSRTRSHAGARLRQVMCTGCTIRSGSHSRSRSTRSIRRRSCRRAACPPLCSRHARRTTSHTAVADCRSCSDTHSRFFHVVRIRRKSRIPCAVRGLSAADGAGFWLSHVSCWIAALPYCRWQLTLVAE